MILAMTCPKCGEEMVLVDGDVFAKAAMFCPCQVLSVAFDGGKRDDPTALVAAPVPIVQCPVCLGTGEALSEDSTDDRKYECWHCYGDGEVKSGNPGVLAKWTQHLPDCARATTTAEACSCGLDDAWRALNVEPV